MYHDVVRADRSESGQAGVGPSHYKLTWERFLDHLDRIGDVVGAPPAVLENLPAEGRASSSWSLTFDDGGVSALEVGEELLRRRWRGYFFITTGRIGSIGFVDADAIRALDRMGHVIGSHSVTHPERMSALRPEELLYEWQASVDALSDVLGKQIRTASVPGGYYRRHVAVAAARAGIATLFTSEPVRTARQVGGCLVIGRYAVRYGTSDSDAARAAAGDPAPWLRQYVGWNLRKPVKALAGDHYERIRRARLAARPTPPAPR
jgi:peptidoglycan/xylan/chitin deacetylase (PgdA/CDA1 family)